MKWFRVSEGRGTFEPMKNPLSEVPVQESPVQSSSLCGSTPIRSILGYIGLTCMEWSNGDDCDSDSRLELCGGSGVGRVGVELPDLLVIMCRITVNSLEACCPVKK